MTYKKSDQDQTSASTKVKTTTDLESKLKQLAASVPLSSIGTEDVYVDQAGKVGVMGNYQTVGHPEERNPPAWILLFSSLHLVCRK